MTDAFTPLELHEHPDAARIRATIKAALEGAWIDAIESDVSYELIVRCHALRVEAWQAAERVRLATIDLEALARQALGFSPLEDADDDPRFQPIAAQIDLIKDAANDGYAAAEALRGLVEDISVARDARDNGYIVEMAAYTQRSMQFA